MRRTRTVGGDGPDRSKPRAIHLEPQHVFDLRGTLYEAVERYFLLRTREFDPKPAALDDYEVEDIAESRWWSADEIAAAGGETFVPRRLASLLSPILAGNVPDAPIDVGT